MTAMRLASERRYEPVQELSPLLQELPVIIRLALQSVRIREIPDYWDTADIQCQIGFVSRQTIPNPSPGNSKTPRHPVPILGIRLPRLGQSPYMQVSGL